MSDPNEAKTLSSKRRLAQILGILKKHHITKGVDPVKFREILEDLGPTFVKIGQIMASRQDMFSERYCKELVKLRYVFKFCPSYCYFTHNFIFQSYKNTLCNFVLPKLSTFILPH